MTQLGRYEALRRVHEVNGIGTRVPARQQGNELPVVHLAAADVVGQQGHTQGIERELADEAHVVGGKSAAQGHAHPRLAARERPAVAPERTEAQGVVLHEVFRLAQCGGTFEVVGVSERRPACLADLARDQAGVRQLARAQRQIQAMLHQVEARVREHQFDRHPGMARAVGTENDEQLVVAPVDRQRHAQQALCLVPPGVDLRLGLQDVFQPARGLAQVGLPRLGQAQAARRALQQRDTQALLQPRHAHAQGGDRCARQARSRTEATGLGHAHEHQGVVQIRGLIVHLFEK